MTSTTTARHRAARRGAHTPPTSTDGPPPGAVPGRRAVVRRFRPALAGMRGRVQLRLPLALLGPLLLGCALWLTLVLVDDVLVGGNRDLLAPVLAGYAAVAVVGGLADHLDAVLSASVRTRFTAVLGTRVLGHVQRLSAGFLARRGLARILGRLPEELSAIAAPLLDRARDRAAHTVQLAVAAALLTWISRPLALVALAVLPLVMLTAVRRARRRPAEPRPALTDTVTPEEALDGLALVPDRDPRPVPTARRGPAAAAGRILLRLVAVLRPPRGVAEALGMLAVLGVGAWLFRQGGATLGAVLVGTATAGAGFAAVRGFGATAAATRAARSAAARVIELLDAPAQVLDPAVPVRLERAEGGLRVEAVTVTRPGGNSPVLENLTIVLPSGRTAAVVGPDGAGKTTLVSLLLRTTDPGVGSVLLDGHDLRDLALPDLRRSVAVVLRETLVVDGTVRDNLLLARPDATEDEIVAAARAAELDEIVDELPAGYDTRLGSGGHQLTAPERRHLAVARAILRDAPIVLLDEPTAGLDAASAERLLIPLGRLAAGRTTLVTSRDLLAVTEADQVVHLEHGRITATGRHRELLTRSPGYAELDRRHRPGAAPEPEPLPAALREAFTEEIEPVTEAPLPEMALPEAALTEVMQPAVMQPDAMRPEPALPGPAAFAGGHGGYPADPWAVTAILPATDVGAPAAPPVAPAPEAAGPFVPTEAADPRALSRFALPGRPDAAPTERFAAVSTDFEVPAGAEQARIAGTTGDVGNGGDVGNAGDSGGPDAGPEGIGGPAGAGDRGSPWAGTV